jgi:S1-C subfamily serine protease
MNRYSKQIFSLLLILAIAIAIAFGLSGTLADADTIDSGAGTNEVSSVQTDVSLVSQSNYAPVAYTTAAQNISAVSLQDELVSLYEEANPAVVYIINSSGSSGSGFVYSDEGHVVTNNHVVAGGGNRFEVVFANGERQYARLIGADADSDLAVIQVEQLPEDIEPLSLADVDDAKVGQFAIAIGNPFGEQGSMSLGIISGLGRSLPSRREVTSYSTYSLPQVIQTDAPINPGNSGGPLLNLDGEVIGVNAAIASTTGTNSGVGFSIPVAAVHLIVPSLIESGEYHYPYMGVSFDDEITLSEQSALNLPQSRGAYVVSVTAGGPADDAGLIAANPDTGIGGDIITLIDDVPITSFADLNGYLVFHTQAGQTIKITALRGSKPVVVSLKLGTRPS